MTDEHGMNIAPEPSPPPGMTEPHDDSSVMEGAGDFTSGEGLVAFAGMVLLAIWLIFDVFLDEYGIGLVTFLLAVLIVLAPRLKSDAVTALHPLPVVMKAVGYTLALIGAYDVIGAIEEGFYDDALTVVAALASYAAFAMAFVGARQIKI
ncbi:MAG TPA: hypothetical protein VJ948_03265 [Acidimicrobiia bacterium]|nr:hypothetical protein [Acidimicrobiia bacterium]